MALIQMANKKKTCRYCQQAAQLLHHGAAGYPYHRDYGPMWVCIPCSAHVGCHPGTTKPLGGLATKKLREWKIKAHAAFDPLWQGKMLRDECSKGQARKAGYHWLSEKLGIPVKMTNIGYFGVEECRKTVEICESIRDNAKNSLNPHK